MVEPLNPSIRGVFRVRRRGSCFLEQGAEELGAGRRLGDAVGLVVVVEERVGLLGGGRELAQRLDPLRELLAVVEVVEALGGAAAARVPGGGVAAVEADVGESGR